MKLRNITSVPNWEPALKAGLDTPCWECDSHAVDKTCGYIKIHRDGINQSVSRYIYEVLFGFLPDKIHVRHRCDNTICINPEHLLRGTVKENIQDCILRGRRRNQNGSKNNMAKLKESDIPTILADNRSNSVIAKEYKVSRRAIRNIKSGKSWASLGNSITGEGIVEAVHRHQPMLIKIKK